jgi:predicted metalloendopeptidase
MICRAAAAALLVCALAAGTTSSAPLGSGLDLSSLDRSVRPQDDLYRFANGAWLDATQIPPDRVSYGAFAELTDRIEQDLRTIIEGLPGRTPAERNIRGLYASVMNTARVEELGLAPLKPVLDRIAGIEDARGVAAECGRLSAAGTGGPFHASAGVDARDPRRLVVHLSQGGTLLPDRSYYLDPQKDDARRAYVRYIATLLRAVRSPDPDANAIAVLRLETDLARAQAPHAGSRTSLVEAEPFTLRQLAERMPGFDWTAWAKPQGIERAAAIILGQPAFFAAFADAVPRVPLPVWKAWLTTRYLTAVAPYTIDAIHDARFELFGRHLTGQQAPRARWKQAVALVNTHMGDALGRLYVERFPRREAAAGAREIISNLLEGYRHAIDQAEWLTPATRRHALDKLAGLRTSIGQPSLWRSYGRLDVRGDDLFGNIERAQKFEAAYQSARLMRQTEPQHWMVSPQTVNAVYLPWRNEILLPSAMLQPPLFDPDADFAASYGALGAIVAHEMTHAFDQQGRRYDGNGEAADWWSAADAAAFASRTSRLADQFNGYPAIGGERVNGEVTLAENVGDLAGLSVAVRAYRLSLGGKPAPVIDGFTGEQRLLIRWAQLWRTLIRPEYLRQTILTNHHAPAPHRANGAVLNLDAFHEAFAVKPGDKLYRDTAARVRLW